VLEEPEAKAQNKRKKRQVHKIKRALQPLHM